LGAKRFYLDDFPAILGFKKLVQDFRGIDGEYFLVQLFVRTDTGDGRILLNFRFDPAGLFFCTFVFRELFCQLAEIFAVLNPACG